MKYSPSIILMIQREEETYILIIPASLGKHIGIIIMCIVTKYNITLPLAGVMLGQCCRWRTKY